MRIKKRETVFGKLNKWIPLLGGMICGFALWYCMGEKILQDEGCFGKELFREIKYIDYERMSYLSYLLKIRGCQLAFIIALSHIRKKKEGLYLWAFMTGGGFSLGIYTMLERWGAAGVAGYLCLIMPHYLCYFYAYDTYQNIDQISQRKREKNDFKKADGISKLVILGVVIIGILLECYVNPFFIKLFVKIFL